ncbi:MAG: hypothetical protein M1834_004993 [Cirrosporium novae-zelandiae]|nr:MAG: hypothetical protein M1834_004993 [Cirrosporium novae-zelandiae]
MSPRQKQMTTDAITTQEVYHNLKPVTKISIHLLGLLLGLLILSSFLEPRCAFLLGVSVVSTLVLALFLGGYVQISTTGSSELVPAPTFKSADALEPNGDALSNISDSLLIDRYLGQAILQYSPIGRAIKHSLGLSGLARDLEMEGKRATGSVFDDDDYERPQAVDESSDKTVSSQDHSNPHMPSLSPRPKISKPVDSPL